MRCAQCGTENPDGAKFCDSCGQPLAAVPPPSPLPVPATPAVPTARCPHCGAELAPEAKFCAGCGQSVGAAPVPPPAPTAPPPAATAPPPAAPRCPSCGGEMVAGTVFCPHCGHSIAGPAATQPMPVPPPAPQAAAPPPAPTAAPSPMVPMAGAAGSCPRCGQPLKPGIRFCGSCGAPTSGAVPPAAAPAPARKSSGCGCCLGLLAVLAVVVLVGGFFGWRVVKTLSPDAFVGDWKIVSGTGEGLDLNNEEELYFTIQPTDGGYQFGPKASEPAPFTLKPDGPRRWSAKETNPDDPSEQGEVVFELLGTGDTLHMTITVGTEKMADVTAARQKPEQSDKPADAKPTP